MPQPTKLAAPQLVTNSRMLYTSWIPADPQACAALLPGALRPAASGAVYMNQYVVDSAEQIRTRAHVGPKIAVTVAGHLRYVTRVGDRLVGGNYPYIGELAEDFAVESIEFLDPHHPLFALRPASPLQVVPGACFYAPRDSFVYPGGEVDLGAAEG